MTTWINCHRLRFQIINQMITYKLDGFHCLIIQLMIFDFVYSLYDSHFMKELYALVDFVRPGVLGSRAAFKKIYEDPILASREVGASQEQKEFGMMNVSMDYLL